MASGRPALCELARSEWLRVLVVQALAFSYYVCGGLPLLPSECVLSVRNVFVNFLSGVFLQVRFQVK